ncbi:MAG: triose-phosphate isomerase [Candidatus Kapabacteria bacterium]|nr:triose-phosphate isomerase [Candidatus Kapabacteria bacterium]
MIIAGNWKMNTLPNEAENLVSNIISGIQNKDYKSEIVVCPPFTNLQTVSTLIYNSKIKLGAQNCFYEPKGAFTGEISIPMLKFFDVEYIIIGHSERRTYFSETDELINKKAKAILESGLKPIICIGETLQEREQGKTFEILFNQLDLCLKDLKDKNFSNIVIAYEPVWAIGTGISATTEQIEEAHNEIKHYIGKKFNLNEDDIVLQYGGSVTADNSEEILSIKNVNGALIGGASLKSEIFLKIIDIAENILQS